MRKLHETEERRAGKRRAKVVRAPPTVIITKRPGRNGRTGGGTGRGGGWGEGGSGPPHKTGLGLAVIVNKFVGLPIAVTTYRKGTLTSSPRCLPSPLLLTHFKRSVSLMQSLVSS